jgi:hypothetical protein
VQGRVVPIDITGEQITVDVQGDALKISSSLDFRQNEAGMPILNMLPEPTALEVDGKTLDPTQLPRVAVGPGGKLVTADEYAKLQLYEKTDLQPGRVLAQPLERGTHTMKVSESLTKASLEPDDRDASLTIYNGKLYVVGGTIPGPTNLSLMQIYDPVANTWSAGRPSPRPSAAARGSSSTARSTPWAARAPET